MAPIIIVNFGISGDLTARKLPAIYNLSIDNLLPTDFSIGKLIKKLI